MVMNKPSRPLRKRRERWAVKGMKLWLLYQICVVVANSEDPSDIVFRCTKGRICA